MKFPNALLIALFLLCTLAAHVATMAGPAPNDLGSDCAKNGGGPGGCPPPPPPPGGGDAGGDGSSSGEPPCPAGEGKQDGDDSGSGGECATPPCNSAMRRSDYGDHAEFWQGNAYRGGIHKPTVEGEAHNGIRGIWLARQDCFFRGNGGVALEVQRMHNNQNHANAASADGYTMFGPGWHMSYDLNIVIVADGMNTYVRKPDGHMWVLYYKSPGVWETNAAHGMSLKLQRLANEYKMTTPDPNVWYTFDNTWGKLKTIRYHNGNLLRMTLDAQGRLSRVDLDHETNDTDNRYIELQYTQITYANGTKTRDRVTRIKAYPWNRTVAEYTYDADNGCLKEVKNRLGEVTERFVHTEAAPGEWAVAEIWTRTAEGGLIRSRVYTYNEKAHVYEVRDGAGSILFKNTFTEQNKYYNTTDMADGTRAEYMLDYSRNMMTGEYFDKDGKLVRTVDQQFKTDSNWYNTSQLIKTVSIDGGATITYDYIDESETGSNADRQSVKKVSFSDGSFVELGYDANHNITTIQRPLGRNSEYRYDANGNAIYFRNEGGEEYYYTYDSKGNVTKKELPTSATIQWAYNAYGKVTETTGTEGRAVSYQYDTYGRPTATTAMGLTTTVEYDERDRATTETAIDGSKTITEYDGVLRRVKSVADEQGRKTSYEYDTSGSLKKITGPDNKSISFDRDFWGNVTKMTDQRGKATTYQYATQDQLTTSTNPLGQKVEYAYYQGEGAGCGCGTGATGKIASIKRADGTVTSFIYESGRVKRKTFDGTPYYVEYTYDVAGRVTAVKDTRIPLAEFGGQTFEYEYDSNDRLTKTTYPDGAVIAYTYDNLGRRTSMTDPDGNVTGYYYNNDSDNKKLDYITHPFGGRTDFTYTTDGFLEEEYRYGNGSLEAYGYDSLKRVEGMISYSEQAGYINQETYTYNSDWMRTRIDYSTDTGPVPAYSKQYAYDTSGRLTEEHKVRAADNASLYQRTYTHDDAGNRESMRVYNGSTTGTIYSNYNAWNQLAGTTQYAYTYNSNGALICLENKSGEDFEIFEHDRENRLTFYDNSIGNAVGYYYDSAGRLLERVQGDGLKTRYYYDGLNVAMEREKPAGCATWRTKKVYTLKQAVSHQIVAEREYTYSGCSTYPAGYNDRWYHYDLAGSVTALTDSNGSVVAQYDQEAFGNVLSGSHEGRHLTAKIYDPVSGLYYFGARWYMPTTGQWIEPEPTGVDGPNLYHFVWNDPVSYLDPNGQFAIAAPIAWPAVSAVCTAIAEGAAVVGSACVAAYGTIVCYNFARPIDKPNTNGHRRGKKHDKHTKPHSGDKKPPNFKPSPSKRRPQGNPVFVPTEPVPTASDDKCSACSQTVLSPASPIY